MADDTAARYRQNGPAGLAKLACFLTATDISNIVPGRDIDYS